MGKPLFGVLDKIFPRDVFHAFLKSLRVGVQLICARHVSLSSPFSSRIPVEVSFG